MADLQRRKQLLERKKELLLQKQEIQSQGRLIPSQVAEAGRGIEKGILERAPEEARTPIQAGIKSAVETAKTLAFPGFPTPTGREAIERPERAGRIAAGVLFPAATAIGFGARKLAESERGREAISTAQERIKEEPIIPTMAARLTNLPATLAQDTINILGKTLSPEEFQKLSADVAETGGFVGTQAAIAKTPLGKDIFALGRKLQNVKLFQSDKALANVANQGKNIIRNITKTLGDNIKKVFKGNIGNKQLTPENIEQVNAAFNRLPNKVLNKLKNESKVFNIILEKGTLKNDAKNIWNTRRFLDNFLKSKDFTDFGPGSIEQARILEARRMLANVLRTIDPKISAVMQAFADFEKKASTIRPLFVKTTTDPTPVFNKLRNLFSSRGEPGVRVVFNQIKELEEIKNFIIAFNRGQLLKKVGLGLTGAVATGLAIRKGREAVGGEGSVDVGAPPG